jgi:hypothetical protein
MNRGIGSYTFRDHRIKSPQFAVGPDGREGLPRLLEIAARGGFVALAGERDAIGRPGARQLEALLDRREQRDALRGS